MLLLLEPHMIFVLKPHGGVVIKRKDYMKRKLLVLLITAATAICPVYSKVLGGWG